MCCPADAGQSLRQEGVLQLEHSLPGRIGGHGNQIRWRGHELVQRRLQTIQVVQFIGIAERLEAGRNADCDGHQNNRYRHQNMVAGRMSCHRADQGERSLKRIGGEADHGRGGDRDDRREAGCQRSCGNGGSDDAARDPEDAKTVLRLILVSLITTP